MSFYNLLDTLGEVNEIARQGAIDEFASNSSLTQSVKAKIDKATKDEQVQVLIDAVDIDKALTPMELADFRDKVEG